MKLYVNLTNGIEAIPNIHGPYGFIRIQSSQCEAKNWIKVLAGIDNDFLMSCALGIPCTVIDYSANKEIPRALYQGLEFVRYVLNRRWHNLIPEKVLCNHMDATEYFDICYKTIFMWDQNKEKNDVKKKIDYFKKFLVGTQVNVSSLYGRTEHDGDYSYYAKILQDDKRATEAA